MGRIYNQMILRKSYEYRDYIHSAILAVADTVNHESPDTPYHMARAAMATRLIEKDDDVTRKFIDRILFRGIMADEICNELVVAGQFIPQQADEGLIQAGILALWNETTLAVWPTVAEDTNV